MAEVDCRDHFFRGRIDRVLVELRLGELRCKRRRLELERVIGEAHLLGERDAALQRHGERLPDGPFRFRLETEELVAVPHPLAFDFRIERDAGAGFLADVLQWRNGGVELDRQRLRTRIGIFEAHRRGLDQLCGDENRLRLRFPPLPTRIAGAYDRRENQQADRARARIGAHLREAPRHSRTQRDPPSRRIPRPAAEHRLQHCCEPAPHAVSRPATVCHVASPCHDFVTVTRQFTCANRDPIDPFPPHSH